nr:uncharacterized protein LOC106687587 [Halyomorpha halys]
MADTVIAKINGEKVSIPLGLKRPKMKDFNVFEQWIAEELAYAKTLKQRLEAGENLPHSIEQEMINWSEQNSDKIKINSVLNTEKNLLFLDMKIKMALRKGDYNVQECLGLLKQLKRLRFTPLLLKKNPEIVKTVERLTRFRGKDLDQREVRKINKYGDRILEKMGVSFNVSNKESFLKVFQQEENEFYHGNLDSNSTGINMKVEEP